MTKLSLVLSLLLVNPAFGEKSVLLIAGSKSAGPAQDEYRASCELLAKHLESSGLGIKSEVTLGWPQDGAKISAADSIVLYSDGLDEHIAKGHLEDLVKRQAAGKGLVLLHGALEPTDPAMSQFLDEALGGHFQRDVSVKSTWQTREPILAAHPVTRGVKSFDLEDEFLYHLRFREGVTPLLLAVPPLSSLTADPSSGNAEIRQDLADKKPQTLAWVLESPNKSRGFGFTGGHFHRNWSNENYRKLVLNAIVWSIGTEVPEGGVVSKVSATPAYQTIDESIAKGDIADVKIHLAIDPENARKGGKPNSRPPLEQAIMRKKPEIAVILLEAGADPNSCDASKRTPLHLAVERNSPGTAAALLKAGAKPDVRDNDGWTPLHHAAAKNQVETAKVILAGGANPMTLSDLGGTPLHEAAASGGAEIIRLFLDHKVDPSVKSKQGVTALDIAKEYKNQPAIDELSKS